ncbi:hypothetical protein BCR37DRAFT_400659 [Protomyces lactucae-debilis]|uniref:Uncharacterized protein n=1 Tax=Protomyces lactucae-debilis TaxID=2754530 RepID=A0A1Y2F1Z3_PROLT|nr:uncharacterized protein BCR37DRAFT_400659 [Protomyces lactucae-debilis]ORY76965.1 hypothetical protein BCR37DRAFT_400659 [Protomyces lactucae-debilis]
MDKDPPDMLSSSSSSDDDLANYRPSQRIAVTGQVLDTAATQDYTAEQIQAADRRHARRKLRAEVKNYRTLLSSLTALEKQDTARHLLQFHLVKRQLPPERLVVLSQGKRHHVRLNWTRWPLPAADLNLGPDDLQEELRALVEREHAKQAIQAGLVPSDEEIPGSAMIVGQLRRFVQDTMLNVAKQVQSHTKLTQLKRMQPKTWKTVIDCFPVKKLPESVHDEIAQRCRQLFGTTEETDEASSLDLSDEGGSTESARAESEQMDSDTSHASTSSRDSDSASQSREDGSDRSSPATP